MNKFLFYCKRINDQEVFLTNDDFRHANKVLRKKPGDQILCTDGAGARILGEVLGVEKDLMTIRIKEETIMPARERRFELVIAPTKNMGRIENMLERCVEMGIDKISFIQTAKTERPRIKMERLQKIATSAMKQSFQYHLPRIIDIMPFQKFIEQDLPSSKFIAHYDPNTVHLKEVEWGSDNCVLVGPEGDFTSEELKMAYDAGFANVVLSDNKLRTETAGLMACAIFNIANH